MNRSLLHTVPHLPVPIDTDQRNPLPSYHVTTSLEQKRVPLGTQQVAACSTGVSPVPLQGVPTRPIEVQPLSPVPSPRGARLPYFVPPKKRLSTVGKWGRIQIASQEPSAFVLKDAVEVEDAAPVEDAQVAFEVGHRQHSFEADGTRDAFEIGYADSNFSSGEEEASLSGGGSDTVLLKERVALPMQRVPLMSVQPLRIATSPVRTQTVAVRRPKKPHRSKKPTSARIW